MNYLELYEEMQNCGMISGSWKNLLRLIETEICNSPDCDSCLKIFTLYFSLIDDGNVYMSLSEEELKNKITEKTERLKIKFKENEKGKEKALESICEELIASFKELPNIGLLPVVGENRLFMISDNKLFTRKHYNAVNEIKESAKRLFTGNSKTSAAFDYKDYIKDDFKLTEMQDEIVRRGAYNNLLITGGPGTGKTTSIFFLLLMLLHENPERKVYLTAPSGKAASRMKESILGNMRYVSDMNAIKQEIERIEILNEYTIHRLLGKEFSNNGFKYNKTNRFPEESVFVVDEASMIDVSIFAALLQAIPDSARVFLLGDKNQLPSVECGAVFGELLQAANPDNIVELVESKRFSDTSEIYRLAEAVNQGEKLPVEEQDWKPYHEFEIADNGSKESTPIYYYSDVVSNNREMIDFIIKKWYQKFYKGLKDICVGLKEDDKDKFVQIMNMVEESRILCSNNETARGTNYINRKTVEECFKGEERFSGFYPGELLMVVNNNSSLNLYNGDNGVAVKFEDDDTLYIMFRKSSSMKLDEGKRENCIFKIGEFLFYPVRLLNRDDIVSAFAITIHKSQGSDYKNILVILPRLKGNPLLNRQIVYTAITRTKGSTYILSNQENLEAARDTVLKRDTF